MNLFTILSGVIGCFTILFVMFYLTQVYHDGGPWIWGTFIAVALTGIAKALGNFGRYINQRDRDYAAKEAYKKVKRGEIIEFALYLRPFKWDDQMKAEKAHVKLGIGSISFYTGNDKTYLEDLLREVLGDYPVIGIGPSERGGKVTSTESQWQEDVEILSKNAKLIFVVPHDSPGCLWELKFMRENTLLNKAIFILPAQASMEEDIDSSWEQIQASFKQYGFQLPGLGKEEWQTNFVRFSKKGKVMNQTNCLTFRWTFSTKKNLRRAIFSLAGDILPQLAD